MFLLQRRKKVVSSDSSESGSYLSEAADVHTQLYVSKIQKLEIELKKLKRENLALKDKGKYQPPYQINMSLSTITIGFSTEFTAVFSFASDVNESLPSKSPDNNGASFTPVPKPAKRTLSTSSSPCNAKFVGFILSYNLIFPKVFVLFYR